MPSPIYMEEEHPSWLDFDKKQFGGPITEEEVEDVKTVLRLLMCISISVSGSMTPVYIF